MVVFTKEHFKIFKLIEENEYVTALKAVEELEKKGPLSEETLLIKIFLLIETQNMVEAERIYKPNFTVKLTGFVKRICWGLNRIMDFKSIMGDSVEEQYETAILTGDYVLAKKTGISLLKEGTIFLVMALILSYNKEKNENDLSLLKHALFKEPKYVNIFILLAKLNICIEFVISSIKRIAKRDFMFYFLLQTIYINYPERRDELVKECESLGITSEADLILLLIDHLDSWDVYEIALEKGLEIPKKDSFNFNLYKLKKERDFKLGNEILKNLESFDFIFQVMNLIGKENLSEEYKMIYEFKEENTKKVYELYYQNKTIFNLKMLLYHLIASKKDEYIVLALYIAKEEKDLYENYEIQIIYLFLCRFFLLSTPVIQTFDELSIKTIQHEKFSYIWNDITLKTGKEFPMKITYLNLHMHSLNMINNLILPFIKSGKIDHVYDLLETREFLSNSLLFKEVKEGKIYSLTINTSFSNILGEKCSYIFAKLTKNHFENFEVNNLFSEVNGKEIFSFLKNDIFDLQNENEFIFWLKNNK